MKAIGSNLSLKDKKLEFQARTPFLMIQKKLDEINSPMWLEPEKNDDTMAQNGYFDSQNAIWGGQPDSNWQPPPPQGGALTD